VSVYCIFAALGDEVFRDVWAVWVAALFDLMEVFDFVEGNVSCTKLD